MSHLLDEQKQTWLILSLKLRTAQLINQGRHLHMLDRTVRATLLHWTSPSKCVQRWLRLPMVMLQLR